MKNRNPFLVFFLPFITLGIYGLYWSISTKNEMNRRGSNIPTAWLLIIPFVSYYWIYKYSEGVEQVTNGKQSTVLAFILQFILGPIGMAIIQLDFNKVGAEDSSPIAAGAPFTPPAGVQPDNSFGGPAPAPITPSAPAAPVTAVNEPAAPVVMPGVITPTQPVQVAQPAPAPTAPVVQPNEQQPPVNPIG